MEYKIKTPIETAENLQTGDIVYLTGTLYTMRDSAHIRAKEFIEKNKKLPFDLKNQAIWHCGPIIKNGKIICAGATTSSRLNSIESLVLEKLGPKLIIGKGGMCPEVSKALQENKAAYLAATGGCAALFAQKIKEIEKIYWKDLGMAEAVYKLKVKDFGPLIVAIDSHGKNLYEQVLKRLTYEH